MLKKFTISVVAAAVLAGCASSQIKARKEQRDKASQTSKLYCDFVNGDLYPDVEVMLNLEMSKRCDSEKAFTITQYKTTNENMGIVYCCSLPDPKDAMKEVKEAKAEHKAEPPKPPEVKKPEATALPPAPPATAAAVAPAAPAAKPADVKKPEAKKPAPSAPKNDDDLGD